MPFLSLLSGPTLKLVGIGLLVLALIAAGAGLVHSIKRAAQAQIVLQQQAAVIKAQTHDHEIAVAALELQVAEARQDADRLARIKGRVQAAPGGRVCAGSPPMRALVDGLRKPAGGPGAATP